MLHTRLAWSLVSRKNWSTDVQWPTGVFNLPPGVSQQAALSAHVHLKGITGDHEALQQQHARSVADQTVSLHLAQTQTSVSGAALRRLPDGGTDAFRKHKQVRWGTIVFLLELLCLKVWVIPIFDKNIGLFIFKRNHWCKITNVKM